MSLIDSLEPRCLLALPRLDSTFGDDGISRLLDTSPDSFSLVEELSNGKILAAGGLLSNSGIVARLKSDGQPDPTFADDGVLLTDSNGGFFFHAALAPDGKIVIITDQDSYSSGGDAVIKFFRFNADGTTDTSFGKNGKVIQSLAGANVAIARSVGVQSDGKIVFSFEAGPNVDDDPPRIGRLNADGTVDTNFRGGLPTPTPVPLAGLEDLVIGPDDKIYLAGGMVRNGVSTEAVVRFNADGSIDKTYGSSGDGIADVVDTKLKDPPYLRLVSIAVDPAGRIVLSGQVDNADKFSIGLARLTTSGLRDKTFGSDGFSNLGTFGSGSVPIRVIFGTKGRIIGAVRNVSNDLALFRVNTNGLYDKSFGRGGKFLFEQKALEPQSLALDHNGNLLVAGQLHEPYDLAIARVVTDSPDVYQSPGGTLFIKGTDGADTITLSHKDEDLIVTRNSTNTAFDFDGVRQVHVYPSAGGDVITIPFAIRSDIDGGTGNDTISVGDGDVTINGDTGNDKIFCGAGRHSISLGPGNNRVITGAGNDRIGGSTGNDTITTGARADYILAGEGDSVITCGSGYDSIFTQDGNDTVHGGAGNDFIEDFPPPPPDLDYSDNEGNALGTKVYFGDDGNDVMLGSSTANTMNGGAGDDHIQGGRGTDVITGGDGNDALTGEEGNDSINGDAGKDTIVGDVGDDLLRGGSGPDRIYGNNGHDRIYGGGGNDILFGGTSSDSLYGQAGDDVLHSNNDGARDHLFGDGGVDRASADEGDILSGVEVSE